MVEPRNIKNSTKNKYHLVLICDETGIFDAFRLIKEHLGSTGEVFLSLIYSVSERTPTTLFEREISILEKRYSHSLFTYTLKVEAGNYVLIQGLIEAIINSNTIAKMHFLIFGIVEFTDYVSSVLEYLNVEQFQKNPISIFN